MTRLSVNVNKIAVLRNSRGGRDPDVVRAARACIDAGAHGITVHPRPDARHIRADDVRALARLTAERGVEFNIEGNPFALPRDGYPGLLALCGETRPAQVTLVPDGDAQLTSDHGFDFARECDALVPLVADFQALGCRVSLFADAGADISAAQASGADRIELFTGPWADAFEAGTPDAALPAFVATAREARTAGLGINAGHDLSQANLGAFLAALDGVDEVSIGHALIGEALYDGFAATVRRYLAIVDAVNSRP